MAPRGRPRKPRNSRMDAAIDHMSKTLGFPEALVRRKMKNLLEVYGGEWVFIEADNYAVLLEAILEEVEQTKNERDDEENSKGENMVENPAPEDENPDLLPSVGSSTAAVEQPTCHHYIINTSTQPPDDSGGSDHPMSIDEDGKGSEYSEVSENFSNKDRIDGAIANMIDGFFAGEGHNGNNNAAAYSPPLVISPPPLEANPPRGRCKPCYGWISDGEDGDDGNDFIYQKSAVRLSAAPPSATMNVKEKKRKTRWDVRPEDL